MFSSIQQSLSFLSPQQKLKYFVLVFIKAFSSFLDVVGIVLIGLLAGLAASNLDSAKPLVILGITIPSVSQETLLILVSVVLIVFTLKAIIAISLGRSLAKFLAKVEIQKAREISEFFFSGDLSNLHRFNKGEITWAVMGSTTTAFSGLLTSLATFVSEGLLLILVAATFFLVDPIATIFVFAYFLAIISLIQFSIGKALKKAGTDTASGSTESVTVLDDTIGAFREITVFDKEDFFIDKFSQSRAKMANSLSTINFLSGMPRYIVETSLMLGVVLFVGFQFATGQLGSGLVTVGVFLTGGVRVMASLLPLQNAIAGVKTQTQQSKMSQDLLRDARNFHASTTLSDRLDSEKSDFETTSNSSFEVTMKNLSFTYPGSSKLAISQVNLSIKSGQHVAFIGPSGAGKTTIADLILGLLEPSDGELVVGGVASNHKSLIRSGLVAYVPQRPGIVSGTIAENVALGINKDEIDEELVYHSLKSANLSEFINSLPEGIHSSVGSQSEALSGGQIQRLGLARAIYSRPKLIVLDEATSALDAGSEAFVSDSLRSLGKEVTVIIIAHRLSTVQHSDVVFVVDQGRLIASGPFSKLKKDVPMVAEYVKLMSFDTPSLEEK